MTDLRVYYDDPDDVWPWGDDQIMVKLSNWCVVLVPRGLTKTGEDMPADDAAMIGEVVNGKAVRSGTMTLGSLVTWSQRRVESSEELSEIMFDRQRALGSIFDRNGVRSSLQWLFENDVPMSARVKVSTVRAKSLTGVRARALVMRCRGWTGIVMCCVKCRVGKDPMPVKET